MEIVGPIGVILFLLFLYAIPSLPLTLLFWFLGRKRANWLKKELVFILIPWAAWLILMFFASTGNKTLSNTIEAFYCGIAGGIILLPRIIFPVSSNKKKLLITSLSTLVATIIDIFIFYLIPVLPE
jgi:hypothetical protein